MSASQYWDITLGWEPGPGEFGCWVEAGAHIEKNETCPTAEQAITLCRQWRKVPPDVVLGSVEVKLRGTRT